MKRLDRYVLKEMAGPMLWGVLIVTLLFQANILIYEYRQFAIESISWTARLQFVLYQTPGFFQMTIPVGVAMGAAMGVSRMLRESEITVLRASGVSILRTVIPLAWVGLLAAGVEFYVSDQVMPRAEKSANRLLHDALQVGLSMPAFRSNVFFKIGNLAVFIGNTSRSATNRAVFNDVLLIEQVRGDTVSVVKAKTGDYENGIFTFRKGYQWIIRGNDFDTVQPKNGVITVNQKIAFNDFASQMLPDEQTSAELAAQIKQAAANGQRDKPAEIKYYSRFSVPLVCVLFGIFSPVLAVRFAKSGVVAGVVLSLFLVSMYYGGFLLSTQVLGATTWCPAVLAAWLPNIVLAIFGMLFLRGLE